MTVWELLLKTFKEEPQQNIKLSMGLFKYGPCVNCTGCRWYQPYSKACKQSWENYQDVKIYSKRNLIQDFHISLSEPKRSSQSYLCHTFLNLNIYAISLPIYTHTYIFFPPTAPIDIAYQLNDLWTICSEIPTIFKKYIL